MQCGNIVPVTIANKKGHDNWNVLTISRLYTSAAHSICVGIF